MNDESLFHLALEKPAAERLVFLEQACGGDAALRKRVEALLRSHETPDSFLIKSVENPEATTDSSSSQVADAEGPGGTDEGLTGRRSSAEGPGSRIGPYKLLQPIGEGGMGTVYMAEQRAPVHRMVALKLIKAGMDSRQVLARFGAERQALALMDHPNIAKVFDAGTTDAGLPYFVMELVKGIPITRFCDEHRLTTRERLELAIPVCQAVQHAHQKGIIHRDIKPSNVLIALYDGKPVPKIIDFGVAKATGPRLTDQTLYTEFGAVVGTLEYMSPEQAQLNQLDIDTRSDIYSLGVLLYELLTGSTPLDRKRLKQGAILEMLRVIREEESPRPSLRLSTTEELPSIAACRNSDPRKLTGIVRGEIDWIVMKALEKDRNRRYETANGLAADLRRHLDDEPVQACPPSARYRLGKFVRRNRAVLVTTALVATALVAGTAVSTWQAIRAFRAERLAQARLQAEKQARLEADDNLRKALDAVDRMLTRVADEKLVDVPQTEGVRKELLADALQFYEGFLQQNKDNPALRLEIARAHRRLGGIFKYDQLSRGSDCEKSLRKASDLLETLHAEDPINAEVRAVLAEVLRERGEIYQTVGVATAAPLKAEPEGFFRRAQELYGGLSVDYPDHPDYANAAIECMRQLAWYVVQIRGASEAEDILREAIRRLEPLVQQHPDRWRYRETLSFVMETLGSVVRKSGRDQGAANAFQEALRIRDSISAETGNNPGHRSERAFVAENLAQVLHRLGRKAEAERHFRDAIDQLAPLVADFPRKPLFRVILAEARLGLGSLLAETGRPDEALRQFREAEGDCEQLVSIDYSQDLQLWAWFLLSGTTHNLANLLESRGLRAEADEAYGRLLRHANAFRAKRSDRADISKRLAGIENSLAWLLSSRPDAKQRHPARAVELAREAVELEPKSSACWNTLGVAQYRAGDWKAAIAALEKSESLAPNKHLAFNAFFLAMARWKLGEKEAARTHYHQAVAWMEKHQPKNEELVRFRAEAAELLGIDKQKD